MELAVAGLGIDRLHLLVSNQVVDDRVILALDHEPDLGVADEVGHDQVRSDRIIDRALSSVPSPGDIGLLPVCGSTSRMKDVHGVGIGVKNTDDIALHTILFAVITCGDVQERLLLLPNDVGVHLRERRELKVHKTQFVADVSNKRVDSELNSDRILNILLGCEKIRLGGSVVATVESGFCGVQVIIRAHKLAADVIYDTLDLRKEPEASIELLIKGVLIILSTEGVRIRRGDQAFIS